MSGGGEAAKLLRAIRGARGKQSVAPEPPRATRSQLESIRKVFQNTFLFFSSGLSVFFGKNLGTACPDSVPGPNQGEGKFGVFYFIGVYLPNFGVYLPL